MRTRNKRNRNRKLKIENLAKRQLMAAAVMDAVPQMDSVPGHVRTLSPINMTPIGARNINASESYLFSTRHVTTLVPSFGSAITADPNDVIKVTLYGNGDRTYSTFFDGSLHGLHPFSDIDAVSLAGDSLIMSFAHATFVGTTSGAPHASDHFRATPQDLVAFDLNNQSFSMFFNGENAQLKSSSENIDGVHVDMESSTIYVSTSGTVQVKRNGKVINGADEDILRFEFTRLGIDPKGKWYRYFDGSDKPVRLAGTTEDIDAFAINGDEIQFSTRGKNKVPFAEKRGSNSDILTFETTRTGGKTRGTYTNRLTAAELGIQDFVNIDAWAKMPSRLIPIPLDPRFSTRVTVAAPTPAMGTSQISTLDLLVTRERIGAVNVADIGTPAREAHFASNSVEDPLSSTVIESIATERSQSEESGDEPISSLISVTHWGLAIR